MALPPAAAINQQHNLLHAALVRARFQLDKHRTTLEETRTALVAAENELAALELHQGMNEISLDGTTTPSQDEELAIARKRIDDLQTKKTELERKITMDRRVVEQEEARHRLQTLRLDRAAIASSTANRG